MVKKLLQTELAYSEWASRRLLAACYELAPDEFTRDLGASHVSIAATLRHIFYAERLLTRRLAASSLPPHNLLGNPKSDSGPPLELDLATLEQHWPPVWQSASEWLEGVTEVDLEQELEASYPGRPNFPLARWKVVVHMVNHSTFHRGQVTSMLRALGHQPPNLDIYTFYLPQ